MGVRLLLLILLAGGLAVFFAWGKQSSKGVEAETEDTLYMGADNSTERPDNLTELQKLVCEQEIGGEEPEDAPDFNADVSVDTSGGKNRLYFDISEAHGWYADGFELEVWWVEEGVTGPDDSPLRLSVHVNDYMKAGETLRTCTEIVPAELNIIGNDMGLTENWEVQVINYCRARETNPERFPLVSDRDRCLN